MVQSQTVPGFSICTPATLPVVLAISGVASNPGGGVLVSFASAEPPLPAPGVIDQGAKIAVTVINAVGLVGVLGVMGVLLTHYCHVVMLATIPIAGLTIALVLSFKTCNVTSRFNEGAHIATAMYLSALTLVVVVPVALVLDSLSVVYIITSLLIMLTNFGVIGIYYCPKLVAIFAPPPETVLTGSVTASSTGADTTDSADSEKWVC
ncbi:hypothetical protein AMAG_09030 [Allomyces macrogynus ATCC 38327]|uniref:G-protein coupled receptors family 3 profile domain-containing protein n=1 Tax=Allomyces macrogynus (strain ATCC 38327) TaxID=578462 RepID=A0A0L0SNA2_ALLM3|nr:hypothetical protein AMAG_09030 [Allomyces macrogynus ATCC 38327]|eukprot:KNE63968.1 hypothetical protein AMAG_09030 [Allomyces macrogynus ATCC 38327]